MIQPAASETALPGSPVPTAGPPPPADPDEQEAMLHQMAETYPHIVAIALEASDGDLSAIGRGCDEQFEFTLDLLLDAFERLRGSGWTSPHGPPPHLPPDPVR